MSLFDFIPGNIKIGILIAWALITASLGAGLYYSVKATATAEAQTEQVKNALSEQTKDFEDYQSNVRIAIAKGQEANNRLQNQYTAAQEQVNELHKLFAEHNIEKIAYRKPVTFTRIINRGTAGVFRNLEDITQPGGKASGDSDKTSEASTDHDP